MSVEISHPLVGLDVFFAWWQRSGKGCGGRKGVHGVIHVRVEQAAQGSWGYPIPGGIRSQVVWHPLDWSKLGW